jgi:hypothetical protein
MKKHTSLLITALALLLALQNVSAQKAGQAQPKAEPKAAKSPPRMLEILEASGYSYTKAKDNVWTIPFQGKTLAQFNVFVALSSNLVVIGAVPVEKKNLNVTPELMRKLLQFNEDLDRVKVGIDEEGDLFIRVDSSLRVMDAEEFKAIVEQVAAATDVVYSGIRQFVTPEK